jgi:hypothetical protein
VHNVLECLVTRLDNRTSSFIITLFIKTALIAQQVMIKSLEVLLPIKFPYRLFSFKFFFENMNSHLLNMYHAAGMNLIYEQKKICYLFPQNEFYQLLKLQNIEEPHDPKYNSILIKGIFGEEPKIEADIEIENEEMLDILQPDNNLNRYQLSLHRLPEPENDIVITDKSKSSYFHHFSCREVLLTTSDHPSFISMIYLESCNDFYQIIQEFR